VTTRTFAVLDAVVEVEAPGEVLHQVVSLGFVEHPQAAGAARVVVEEGADGYRVGAPAPVGPVVSSAQCLILVLGHLNRLAIEQCRDFAVHAGVVARGGGAVVFPAPSGAGKSTLVAACLRAGYDYVSDEALVLAPDATVRVYAKPLSLHVWTLRHLDLERPPCGLDERPARPAELGACAARGELRVAHVVLPSRVTGPPSLTPLPKGQLAAELLRSSFNHYRDPAGSVSLAARAAAGARGWLLEYDDPQEAGLLLRTRLV
jgi:hypothetical protein